MTQGYGIRQRYSLFTSWQLYGGSQTALLVVVLVLVALSPQQGSSS